jgi:hypothetical protein
LILKFIEFMLLFDINYRHYNTENLKIKTMLILSRMLYFVVVVVVVAAVVEYPISFVEMF